MTIADQINRVIRRVTSADDAHTVTLEQHFATTPADLWSACTDPSRLGRWFEPVDGDLRQGGRYRLTGSGTEGTIETCESPTCLRITWEYGGDISRVAVTILDTGQGATLHLEHAMSDNEHWQTYGPAAVGAGWDESLLGLALLLDGDPRSTPESMAAFGKTPEGEQFLVDSIAAWTAVHVAAGADLQEAELAALRAREAYSNAV